MLDGYLHMTHTHTRVYGYRVYMYTLKFYWILNLSGSYSLRQYIPNVLGPVHSQVPPFPAT